MKHILVISHERSGTHFLINTLARNFGYPETQIDLDNTRQVNWRDSDATLRWLRSFPTPESPRIFKSHHSIEFFDAIIPQLQDNFHTFHISRDGRDVMTSFWVYLNRLAPGWGPRTETVGQFMRATATGGITQYQYRPEPITMLDRWFRHVSGWQAAPPFVHQVRYEDLHAHFEDEVSRIAETLGTRLAQARRPPLSAPSSLPWKGVVGNWRNYFTETDKHYYRQHVEI